MKQFFAIVLVAVLASLVSAEEPKQQKLEECLAGIGTALAAVELPAKIQELVQKIKEAEPDILTFFTDKTKVRGELKKIATDLNAAERKAITSSCIETKFNIGESVIDVWCLDEFYDDDNAIRKTFENNEKAKDAQFAWTGCNDWMDISSSLAGRQELRECYTRIGRDMETIEIPKDAEALGAIVQRSVPKLSEWSKTGRIPSIKAKMENVYARMDEMGGEIVSATTQACYNLVERVEQAEKLGGCGEDWKRDSLARLRLLQMGTKVQKVFFTNVGCINWCRIFEKARDSQLDSQLMSQ